MPGITSDHTKLAAPLEQIWRSAGIEHKLSEMPGLRVMYLNAHYFIERHTLTATNDREGWHASLRTGS